MLVNKGNGNIVLKWDGLEAVIKPQQSFNVGQFFDVKVSELSALEARFLAKHKDLDRISDNPGGVTPGPLQAGPTIPEIEKTPEAEPAEEEEEGEEAPIKETGARPLSDHNKSELQTMAKSLGIEFTEKTTKAELIKSIDATMKASEE